MNPEVMRPRLMAASIYIAGFQALRDSVVGRIRDFFWVGFDKSGDKIDPKYMSDVLSRNKSPLYASLDWLKEMNAINDHDLSTFDRVKACRNTLAHKLFSALGTEGLPADFEQCFTDMVSLLRKIEVWWITNVDIPTNPDYDGSDIDEDGLIPGPVMGMQLLFDIALGDDKQSKFYYNQFRTGPGSG
ncbi:hypothetical protein [Candidatus Manganitrophus noduliformans]|uniref:Uncharacterized protein n=1 Tax=Candidatus Manganitrophus noduliformans TaxID=2606439 RepID=A0A7X6DT24_9BACT|nr:hypothetical protein [Candidatus Manganitrophus noduliformans]NKE72845.1 hypothetical protein [Candidatus Manganitrophus noduliformans]